MASFKLLCDCLYIQKISVRSFCGSCCGPLYTVCFIDHMGFLEFFVRGIKQSRDRDRERERTNETVEVEVEVEVVGPTADGRRRRRASACVWGASMFCAVSGTTPKEPVVTPKGVLYERSVIVKAIEVRRNDDDGE